MSVILDALKRVQDENHRRGTAPGTVTDYEPARDAEEMVERLATYDPEPEAQLIAEPRRLSPLTWVAIIALGSAGVITAALWWFEPDFTGAQANAGRPLLTDMRATPTDGGVSGTAPAAAPQQPVVDMSPGDAARANAATSTDTAVSAEPNAPAEPEGRDLSDLSAALPPATTDNQPVVQDEAPSFDLRSYESTPRAEQEQPVSPQRSSETGSDSGFINLRSSADDEPTPARVPETRRTPAANDNPFAAPEPEAPADAGSRTLVDPSVRSGFERGLQLQKSGDMSGAEDAYLRALKLDPDNARINANLAVLYEGQGRFQLAERHLRNAINVEPNNASARNNLGVVLYRMGNFDGALIEFNRALALDPKQLDAYTNKGLIFMRWGRYEDARRAFAQVLVADPENALAHYNLGLVYEELQMWDQAIDSYYRFLDSGGSLHPDIVQYVSQRLPWVESRLSDGGR
jgi:type IV pilus biogenesis/stability protein PilW